jgi:hypothetical protein
METICRVFWPTRIMNSFLITIIFAAVLLTGCSSLKPRDFTRDNNAPFEPDDYFTGTTRSWGVLENRAGQPRKWFSTECIGTRDEAGDLNIRQTFTHDDGSTQLRLWHVHRIDTHHFSATANDVVGTVHGEAWGNVFQWKYTIELKPGNPFSRVHLRQWMYLQPGTQTMFTRAVIKKFGITLGEVAESFQRIPLADH